MGQNTSVNWRALAVSLVLGIALAGCTSGNDTSDDGGSADSGSSAGNQNNNGNPGTPSTTVGSIRVMTIQDTVDAGTAVDVQATVSATDGQPLGGRSVTFSANRGRLSAQSATTDSSGLASVTFTAPQATGSVVIGASVDGQSASQTLTVVPGELSSLTLLATPSTLAYQRAATVIVSATDAYDNPIADRTISLTASGTADASGADTGRFEASRLTTDENGQAQTVFQTGDSAGETRLIAQAGPTRSEPTSITVDPNAARLQSLGLTRGNSALTADGTSQTFIRARVQDTEGRPVAGVGVSFETTAGKLTDDASDESASALNADAITDSDGIAEVFLRSEQRLTTANVTARIAGLNETSQVMFVPGPADAANSSLSIMPGRIPADGMSTARVVVVLADAAGNPVADDTSVALRVDNGTLVDAGTRTTTNGRAEFNVRAPSQTGSARIQVADLPALAATLRYGAVMTGRPTSITASTTPENLSVSGVGQTQTASISIRVTDDQGTPISEAGYDDPTRNNLRVALKTRPNGGEYLSGTNAAGETVTSRDQGEIDVRTQNGVANLTFNAGTRPGVIELQTKALAYDGTDFDAPDDVAATASLPRLTIAAGPAATLAFTGGPGSVSVVSTGVYAQRATLLVTDRYGNNVADDTPVSLGVVDSVIAEGQGSLNDRTLQADAFWFDIRCMSATNCQSGYPFNFSSAIVRNDTTRMIRSNDRVLALDAPSTDRLRFVDTANASDALTVTSPYATDNDAHFAVGTAALGATLGSLGDDGTLNTGAGRTTDGRVALQIRYPANTNTLNVGCLGRMDNGHYSTDDKRFTVPQSAQLYLTAAANDADATGVSNNQFCFQPLPGATLRATPGSLDGDQDTTITLQLVDGNGVALPFEPIGATARVTNRNGAFDIDSVQVLNNAENNKPQTGIRGQARARIRVNCDDGASCVQGDSGTVTFYGADASVDVTIQIP